MPFKKKSVATIVFCATAAALSPTISPAAENTDKTSSVVDAAIKPIMAAHHIPGMAVAISINGKDSIYTYGVASTKTKTPVTPATLFEIGSISKTFTATMAAKAQVDGRIDLNEKVAKYWPQLKGTRFGDLPLLSLGTHTPGVLPLQLPDNVKSENQLEKYLSQWKPTYPPGTYRSYTNPGIGTLGLLTAKAYKQDFAAIMQQTLLPALGLKHTFIDVPEAEQNKYAQGYTEGDQPARMNPGVIAAEAYGIKTTAGDLLQFLKENMAMVKLDSKLQDALNATHTGYFKIGGMTQDLMWEQFAYPAQLSTILLGCSPAVVMKPNPAVKITPPERPRDDVWINKTGSTNGFAAYAVFIPSKHTAIVILANKQYPIKDRVTAAYHIIEQLP